ncbi:hypothetical protein [Chryseolinea sp. H1M3-3]|uniref:hypothetical protein n=1 Tax=Chryseolinea sp. H1M3-3 TaxID=3034144 RepID=UPI0023EDB24F|nr:hypothetical protein [Chryseolinea sp. H1M3-3]
MLSESFRIGRTHKMFFSDRFNIELTFSRNGGITGTLFPFPALKSISSDISGLYTIINSNTVLSFFCKFKNPNVITKTEILFEGEIIEYENNHECLIIKWLAIQNTFACQMVDKDIEILLDTQHQNGLEAVKIHAYMKQYSLEIMS